MMAVDSNSASRSNLAERKRELVRDELAQAAVNLLAFQEFEDTTVDQIVSEIGVSRRTFFRYFQSKEDVIVHIVAGAGTQFCTELRARPASEPTAVALRQALAPFIRLSIDNRVKTLRIAKLIFNTPTILGRFLERLTQWQAGITEILAERSGLHPEADLRPTLAAGVALTAFHNALRRWADTDGGQALAELVDQAFAVVTPALDLPKARAASNRVRQPTDSHLAARRYVGAMRSSPQG
jgi:AcrR family transcriptional regulator